ncbi:MAG TPA: NERD domain-containing protein [Streptosporangiaceae bacterium]|nr:NERD domain-containing protein [Streptosporangiaceae bacterium]
MTVSNRSGAAHDGTRSQGKEAEGAPEGSARLPFLRAQGARRTEAAGGAEGSGPVRDAPGRDAPVSWPGQAADEAATAEGTAAEVAGAEATGPEPAAAEPESADLPLWDWSPPAERSTGEPSAGEPSAGEPSGAEPSGAERPAGEPAAGRADPPKPEWKPVVTPVEEVGESRPGIGQRRGNLAHLSANPRMRIWQLRAVVAVVILGVFWYLVSWKLGLTLAVVAIIADTIYRARKSSAGKIRLNAAQRRTRRQLTKLGRAGYLALHARPIPESQDQIDHLVVGPAGVFAIDSENWDKRLAVRTKSGKQLWHGPFSKKDRLQHAQWEAQRAADLLSGAIGKPVVVRPAMAVYGPRIPWDVATIRDVDVFSGPRLRKYLRRRARQAEVRPLTDEEIERIFKAANEAFPHHLSAGSPAR